LNIDVTLYGQLILIFVLVITPICYYLGKRKTQTPKIIAFVGALFSLVPPMALIFVTILAFKKDTIVVKP